jgi:hypothetical protein
MLNKLLIGAGLALCVAACASTPSAPGAAMPNAATANLPPAGCVPATATRLPISPQECAAFGRTYTQEDIRRTGSADTAQALRLLDPAITVKQ